MRIKEVTKSKNQVKSPLIWVFAYYQADDAVAAAIVKGCLVNEAKQYDLGRGWRVAYHRAHVPHTQDHLHFSFRGRDLYSINKDSTAHDASHGEKLSNAAVDGMRKLFPDFRLPPNNVIESLLKTSAKKIVENISEAVEMRGKPLVPAEIIEQAMQRAASPDKGTQLLIA